MERQTGLGRSLGDVLDSLTPADPDPTSAGRVLFEPEDLEQQLDQLMGDIRDLRDRMQHLAGLAADDAVAAGGEKNKKKHKKHGEKKQAKKSKKKTKKHKHKAKKKAGEKAGKHGPAPSGERRAA